MDAFFAAVEERNNPRFQGLPIAVGADPAFGRGRGVVSTANYLARAYGIGSGQSIRQAWKLSQLAKSQGEPEVIFLPGSWNEYSRISKHVMDIIAEIAPEMQQRSVDEAYCDLSFVGSLEAAAGLARGIQEKIYEAENLTASIGLGPNKLVAKIASDFEKPAGFTVVDSSHVQEFLAPLPVRAIPGIGPKTNERLGRRGIATIADLQKRSYEELEEMLGKWGGALYYKARGEDDSPVVEEYERKSIGQQRTFREDVAEPALVIEKTVRVARDVFQELLEHGYVGARTVAITVRFHDFSTTSCAHTSKKVLEDSRSIEQEAVRLLLPFLDARRNPQKKSVRLVGVRLEKLSKEKTLPL